MERRRQTSQGPQDPKNYMVVRSLDFIFASDIQNLQLRTSVTQRHQLVQPRKAQQKIALSR